MAKRDSESSEPVISSIPVPPSDSALVIDLPDGQKLLVGKIETGTVIEVATWRGTGRPDSRTNRLMLGMSNESDAKQPKETEAPKPVTARDLKFPKNIQFVVNKLLTRAVPVMRKFIFKLFEIIKNVKLKNAKFPKIKISKLKLENKFKKVSSPEISKSLELEEDFDVDFQRILDEVSQRRSASPKKPPQPGTSTTKKISSKGSKSKNSKKKVRSKGQ